MSDFDDMKELVDCRITELEEDLRIANNNLEALEKWHDRITKVYPAAAFHITRMIYNERKDQEAEERQ